MYFKDLQASSKDAKSDASICSVIYRKQNIIGLWKLKELIFPWLVYE